MFYIFIVLILMIFDIDALTLNSHPWKGIKLLRAIIGARILISGFLLRMRRMYVASIRLDCH